MLIRTGGWKALRVLAALAFVLVVGTHSAQALTITPSGAIGTTTTQSAFGPSDWDTEFGFLGNVTGLVEWYRAQSVADSSVPHVATESGALSSSYVTQFTATAVNDYTGGTITHVGAPALAFQCPNCYMVVKDGKQSPAQYLFNLGTWDGVEAISFSGFWAGGPGSIGHVAIYSVNTYAVPLSAAPEPGTLGLVAVGLALLAGPVRRRLMGRSTAAP